MSKCPVIKKWQEESGQIEVKEVVLPLLSPSTDKLTLTISLTEKEWDSVIHSILDHYGIFKNGDEHRIVEMLEQAINKAKGGR